jgi:hypothetical protein
VNDAAFQIAASLVRLWTRLYTRGLPPALRDRRREEIASDLWELEHDPDRKADASSALRVLARMVAGLPDDVGWRMEQHTVRKIAIRSTIALAVIALVLVIAGQQALRPPALPDISPAPPPDILTLVRRTPPLPPPPPPPKPGEKPDPNYWSPRKTPGR